MEEFNTIDKAEELFRSVGDVSEKKYMFFAFYDTTKEAMTAGVVGGALGGAGLIGGAIAGAVVGATKRNSNIAEEVNKRRDGYLLKWTSSGIGIIPLNNDGVMWSFSSAKLKVDLTSYFFVSNEEIKNIIVKNYNVFNKSIKKIKVVLQNNQKLCMIARMNEKSVPYQTENLAKFVEQYQNK